MKSVKIGLSLFLVFILSYIPPMFAFIVPSVAPIHGYFRFSFYLNHLANFFIYLFVDEEFRAKLRALFTSCM